MDTMQTGIVTLMKSVITGNRFLLQDDFDIDAAYPAIKAHHIMSLGYAGALNCGVDQKKPDMQMIFKVYGESLQINERQMGKLTRVFAAFDERKIDYLPLKGCVMKSY